MKDQSCLLELPHDKKIIETPNAHLWMDDDGILNCISKGNKRTMKDIRETVRVIKTLAQNKKICFLADTSNTTYYTIEMRDELSNGIRSLFKAIALVPCKEIGKVIGNMIFARKNSCPVKYFEDLEEAKAWLKKFI